MSHRTTTLIVLGAAALICGSAAAGYLLGRTGATTKDEANRARTQARQQVLANSRTAEHQALFRIRRRGVAQGNKRGLAAGAQKGEADGAAEAASNGNGPTPLPPPMLATDITVPSLATSTLADRPAKVIVGNHSVIEGIAWSTWGNDVAEGNATLVGVDCIPSCAEGPEVRHPITIKAWEPSFTPDNARYYSKITMLGPETERFTVEIQAY
jgi:hypothetical protein